MLAYSAALFLAQVKTVTASAFQHSTQSISIMIPNISSLFLKGTSNYSSRFSQQSPQHHAYFGDIKGDNGESFFPRKRKKTAPTEETPSIFDTTTINIAKYFNVPGTRADQIFFTQQQVTAAMQCLARTAQAVKEAGNNTTRKHRALDQKGRKATTINNTVRKGRTPITQQNIRDEQLKLIRLYGEQAKTYLANLKTRQQTAEAKITQNEQSIHQLTLIEAALAELERAFGTNAIGELAEQVAANVKKNLDSPKALQKLHASLMEILKED